MAWRNSYDDKVMEAVYNTSLPTFTGKKIFVDPVNGTDGGTGDVSAPLKTLAAAWAKATTNKNDVIYMVGGASAFTLTAAFDWSKSYTHLVGLAAPVTFGIRNRIKTATASVSPLFTVSGNGCTIANVMITQEGSHATGNAIAAKVTGARNYFQNVHIRNISLLGAVDASKRDLVLNSSDGENYFKNCTFGSDTYDGTANAANYVLEFNGTAQTARNTWDNCWFLGSGSTGASFILATTTSCVSSMQLFKNCVFYNNDNGTLSPMTQAFAIDVNCGGQFIFIDSWVYGAATLQTTNSANVIVQDAAAAATSMKLLAGTF